MENGLSHFGFSDLCKHLGLNNQVGYFPFVGCVRGGSGIRREPRWPVKYDHSHWRCTRRRFWSCGSARM
jgi:hypothetical protein